MNIKRLFVLRLLLGLTSIAWSSPAAAQRIRDLPHFASVAPGAEAVSFEERGVDGPLATGRAGRSELPVPVSPDRYEPSPEAVLTTHPRHPAAARRRKRAGDGGPQPGPEPVAGLGSSSIR